MYHTSSSVPFQFSSACRRGGSAESGISALPYSDKPQNFDEPHFLAATTEILIPTINKRFIWTTALLKVMPVIAYQHFLA
jgi:hypothetical protein